MTPEDQAAIAKYAREIAKILHRNTDEEAVQTREGIEKTVRAQVLEHVNPEIALFLSKRQPGGEKRGADAGERSSGRWEC